ncbi:MAG: SHOCT domain-containing protein [Candidatus Loosdrechtia sp.]|uniref:SHOCT domain-containing protein n=1 Tax=Candidatus Loosdrechtia sp. TaxID=3101272 RepID=UPI003A6C4207|nr:MAG: SHOCT domain-containing protein [Candidatus Jettenia sp. AMX2]
MWYGPFNWLLFFLVIGVALYLFVKYKLVITTKEVRKQLSSGSSAIGGESPLGILEKRFARGEITEQEFERMKKKLEET